MGSATTVLSWIQWTETRQYVSMFIENRPHKRTPELCRKRLSGECGGQSFLKGAKQAVLGQSVTDGTPDGIGDDGVAMDSVD